MIPSLDTIKNGASSSIYLQVTGTPQAILLQTLVSGWHPYFTYYFAPGNGYLGGDFFFPKNKKADCISFLAKIKNPEREVVIHHIAVSAQTMISGGRVCNCLLHPSVRQAVHSKYETAIKSEIAWCRQHIADDFRVLLEHECDFLNPEKKLKASYSDVYTAARNLLLENKIGILVMNGRDDISSDQYSTGFNIVIGGNTLGRGVTFPGLQTIYYTRTSKKPQADTMWQHSRMFGYDRDPGMMRVYIDEPLYKLFADINATNNSIIAQLEKGAEHIKLFYPDGLKPTRTNVLDNQKVYTISGGTNYYPYYPSNHSIDDLDNLMQPFDDGVQYYQVSLRLIKEIFAHISSADDFKVSSFVSIINTILAEQPTAQGILIVRRNRNVAQGTGALLSPNDWTLGAAFPSRVVLTMYKVTGQKGWGDSLFGFLM